MATGVSLSSAVSTERTLFLYLGVLGMYQGMLCTCVITPVVYALAT